MRDACVQRSRGAEVRVDTELTGAVRKERRRPLEDGGWKTHRVKGEEELLMINIVEESFDVHSEQGCRMTPVTQGRLDVVGER